MIGTAVAGFRQLSAMGALPYFGGVALLALVAGLGMGFYGGQRWEKADTAEARAERDVLRADFKAAAATGQADGERRHREALQALLDHERDITAAVQGIPARIQRQIAGDLQNLRRSIDAPEFDCLRLPYPDAGLRLLERTGSPSSSDGDRNPEAAAAAGDLF